jgi:hypothetical protein
MPCPRALSRGAALPAEQLASLAREIAGAEVAVHGRTATVGPLDGLPRPIRLQRLAGRWLIRG